MFFGPLGVVRGDWRNAFWFAMYWNSRNDFNPGATRHAWVDPMSDTSRTGRVPYDIVLGSCRNSLQLGEILVRRMADFPDVFEYSE